MDLAIGMPMRGYWKDFEMLELSLIAIGFIVGVYTSSDLGSVLKRLPNDYGASLVYGASEKLSSTSGATSEQLSTPCQCAERVANVARVSTSRFSREVDTLVEALRIQSRATGDLSRADGLVDRLEAAQTRCDARKLPLRGQTAEEEVWKSACERLKHVVASHLTAPSRDSR